MIFQTWQTPEELIQSLTIDTDAIVYTNGAGVVLYDTKPSEVTGTRWLKGAGDYPPTTEQWQQMTAGQKQNIKDYLRTLYNNGIIELNVDTFAELENIVDELPIYRRTSWGLQVYSTSPLRLSASGTGFCGGAGSMLAPQLNDIINANDYANVTNVNFGETQFTQTAFEQCPVFLNLLARGIDENLVEASDELKKFVDENLIPIETNLSVKWDVYFDVVKEKLVINKTVNVLVRWSCEAINKAVEEFIALHPDYMYRADNTVVWLKVTDTHARSFYDAANILYGDLQYSTTVADLQQKAGINDFVEAIGSFTPMTNLGDVCICCYLQFEDGNTTSVCIQQIPMNSLTTDTEQLYHKNGRDGSTITAHYGLPTEGVNPNVVGWNDIAYDDFIIDDDFQDNDSSTDFTGTNGVNSSIGLLTDTYILSEQQLRSVGQKIWDGNFTSLIDAMNSSPIENIISVKAFPFNISGGTDAEIVLGNVEMGVHGNKLAPSFNPTKTIGTFTIPKPFTGKLEWLSYAPYSSIQMFLPYVGIVEIDPALVYGKQCTLKYIYDVICGNCQACLYVNDDVQHSNIELYKWTGELAIDIPITASNRVAQSIGYLTNGVNAVASLFKKDFLGAFFGAIDTLTVPFKTTTTGTPSSSCDSYDMQEAYLMINFPIYDEPTTFAHDFGYPCEVSATLSELHGFTKCKNVHFEHIACTEEDRRVIEELLEGGVYL